MKVPLSLSRYQLKRSYQPNMMKGWVVVLGFLAISSVYIGSLGPEDKTGQDLNQYSALNNLRVDTDEIESSSELTARNNIGGFNPRAKEHQGFLGFNNIEIIREESGPSIQIETPPIYTLDELAPPVDDLSDISFSTIEGDASGMYIPEDYLPDGFVPQEVARRDVVLDRPVQVDPVHPRYPNLARRENIEGEVTVRLCIGGDGRIRPFVAGKNKEGNWLQVEYLILNEEPKGYYFATSVIDVLPQWIFAPCIENGQVTDSFIDVTYKFCFACSERMMLRQMGRPDVAQMSQVP